MAWVEISKDYPQFSDPIITLKQKGFFFNKAFVKLAEIVDNRFVRIFVDHETFKIGFEFVKIKDSRKYKVNGTLDKGFYVMPTALLRSKWVKKLYKEETPLRFTPVKNNGRYVIHLHPSFENSINRDRIEELHRNQTGIYRLMDDENVVYIGCGKIRERVLQPEREDWKFNSVDYSEVDNRELRYEFEKYWLDMYKERHGGELPFYNKINGVSVK